MKFYKIITLGTNSAFKMLKFPYLKLNKTTKEFLIFSSTLLIMFFQNSLFGYNINTNLNSKNADDSFLADSLLIPFGSTWFYFDTGSGPPPQGQLAWNHIGYDDSSWPSGEAQLGHGDGDEATTLNDNINTFYARHDFYVNDAQEFGQLDLHMTYDDGAVVYLNGVEIWRLNLPQGPISYSTTADSTSDENAFDSTSILSSLVGGLNVLAVEIHQVDSESSDMSFDLQLTGISAEIIRGPYLQKASPTSMVIKWRTSVPTPSSVDYGTSISDLEFSQVELIPKTEHEIEITGLVPNTKYFYRIGNNYKILVPAASDLHFITYPEFDQSQPLTAWILGDCGKVTEGKERVRDAYYSYIGSKQTDMILFLGDNAYEDGTDVEYQAALFENAYEDKLKNTVSWSCIGNHEVFMTSSSTQTGPYYDIFTFPKNGESGGVASGTEAYYSFDYGNVHFICLDSYDTDRGVGEAMYNWCQNDIQNTTADWIIAFWHHPPYSKGENDSDMGQRQKDMREDFLPLLESNGVDLVLAGHSHSYERSHLLNGHYGKSDTFDDAIHVVGPSGYGDGKLDSDGAYTKISNGSVFAEGTTYVVTGSTSKLDYGPLDHPAMFYSVVEFGSCVLDIDGDQLTLKFLRETGEVEDYFTIIKRNCLEGSACDDLDPCTINDVFDESCECSGIYSDVDGDGYCTALDPDDTDGCVPDENSSACVPCTTLASDDFEAGFGNWNDGGIDCFRESDNGDYYIRLKGNSGTHSSTFTDELDFSPYNEATIDFSVLPFNLSTGDGFLLEVMTDDGGNFTLFKEWFVEEDFQSGSMFTESVLITGINFTSTTVFRFRSKCLSDGHIELDDIKLQGCENPTSLANKKLPIKLKFFPNPTGGKLKADFTQLSGYKIKVSIFNLQGVLIQSKEFDAAHKNIEEIDLGKFSDGTYLIHVSVPDMQLNFQESILLQRKQ